MKVETSRAAGSAVLASQSAVSPGWGLQDPLGKLGTGRRCCSSR